MGLLKPSDGKIYCNGINYCDLDLSSIRSMIGYVSQDLNLFNGSLRENITFWSKENESNDKKIKKVMKLSGCYDCIRELTKIWEIMPQNYLVVKSKEL